MYEKQEPSISFENVLTSLTPLTLRRASETTGASTWTTTLRSGSGPCTSGTSAKSGSTDRCIFGGTHAGIATGVSPHCTAAPDRSSTSRCSRFAFAERQFPCPPPSPSGARRRCAGPISGGTRASRMPTRAATFRFPESAEQCWLAGRRCWVAPIGS